MASEHLPVGGSSVVSLLLLFCLLPLPCSSATPEGWLQYSLADGIPDEHHVVEVKELSLVREKRQAPAIVSPVPANSSEEDGTHAPTVATVASSPAPGVQADSDVTNTTLNTPPAVTATPSTTPTPITSSPPTTTTLRPPTTTSPLTTASQGSTPATTTPRSTQAPTTPESSQTSTLQPVIIRDNHKYYELMIIPDAVDDYYVTLTNPMTHDSLNSAHRLAGMIGLPFKFRFYGHIITNVTLATGGFIYMSPFLHRFLASTQYIAPLMANFHTAASNDSNIYFQHVGNEFVIEWQNVMLKDEEEKGPFTFQAKLKIDGTITFVYKQLPIPVTNISGITHPVKIGLSDAFYNDTHIPEQGIIRRRIIEYHRVVIGVQQVEEGTVVILKPFPTCNTIEDCDSCARHEGVKFECKWCSTVGRCSDGMDWYRQNWEQKGCKDTAHEDPGLCNLTSPSPTPSVVTTPTHPLTTPPKAADTTRTTTTATTQGGNSTGHGSVQAPDCPNGSCSSSGDAKVAAAVTISVLLLILLVAMGIWAYYAYTHPTSASGIWLMEHRPSAMRAKLANMSCCRKKATASSKYAMESTA